MQYRHALHAPPESVMNGDRTWKGLHVEEGDCPMAEIEIRKLHRDDRAAWEPLWQGYLAFYKTSVSEQATQTAWEIGRAHV